MKAFSVHLPILVVMAFAISCSPKVNLAAVSKAEPNNPLFGFWEDKNMGDNTVEIVSVTENGKFCRVIAGVDNGKFYKEISTGTLIINKDEVTVVSSANIADSMKVNFKCEGDKLVVTFDNGHSTTYTKLD